jgi:Ankyrin repeats (3 copies)/Ankyrin repeat
MINIENFPSLKEIFDSPTKSWSDSDMPLAKRGVSVSWLIEIMRNLLEDINRPRAKASAEAEQAIYHNKAGMWGLHDQPDIAIPEIPNYALLNARSFVDYFVLPLTAAMRAPLWSLVPEDHRGTPNYFLSHTWNSLLLGPAHQEIGTLDSIEHLGQFAWIDFVSYNQHTFESIPTDMEAVIGDIGKVIIAGTPIPTLNRIWCLWELLCANRTGTDFDITIKPGFRNDKILAVNTLYRSFVGVEKAIASNPDDLKIISKEVLAQFGSTNAANKHLDQVLRERFSGPWYELRDRDQHLGFRPWPWLAEQGQGGKELANRPVKENGPYYGAGFRDTMIYGSHQNTFDLLIKSGLKVDIEDKTAHQVRTTSEIDFDLIDACRNGDIEGVREFLTMGANPNHPVAQGSALAFAARRGHIEIVDLLLKNGADIEGGEGLSPLACAAYKGKNKMIRLLIDRGADIEGDSGGPGTALFQAASKGHLSTVRLLLKLGANVNAKTEKRATPLLIASSDGHVGMVEALIKAGADLECTDRSGDTALHHAAYNGWPDIIRVLIKAGAARNSIDKYGDTPFNIGERNEKVDATTLGLLQP